MDGIMLAAHLWLVACVAWVSSTAWDESAAYAVVTSINNPSKVVVMSYVKVHRGFQGNITVDIQWMGPPIEEY